MTIDEFKAQIKTIATGLGLVQLPNAYDLPAHSTLFLKNGFGIVMAPATFDPATALQEVGITLILTKQSIGNAQSPTQIEAIETALTGSGDTIINQLGDAMPNRFNYVSDNGIENFGGEDDNEYLFRSILLNVRFVRRDLLTTC